MAELAQVRILDTSSEDNLALLYYLESDPRKIAGVEHVRGIIIDLKGYSGIDPIIVAGTFPPTTDYTVSLKSSQSSSETSPKLPFDSKLSVVTRAREGTVLRMFQGRTTKRWYLSTHKKIDGRKSKWAGKFFGESFSERWGDRPYEEYMDSRMCYIYLLSLPDERLVSHILSPELVLIGQFLFGTEHRNLILAGRLAFEKDHPSVSIQTRVECSSIDELIRLAGRESWKDSTGFLITNLWRNSSKSSFSSESVDESLSLSIPRMSGNVNFGDSCIIDTASPSIVKVFSNVENFSFRLIPEEYVRLRELRGNEPTLQLRYLQLKSADNESDLQDFKELFSEKKDLFSQIERDYSKIVKNLARLYHQRYVQRKFIEAPLEEHVILENTRREYDHDLSLAENIQDVLSGTRANYINTIIRRMREEKKNCKVE
jgi:hypothetical protein